MESSDDIELTLISLLPVIVNTSDPSVVIDVEILLPPANVIVSYDPMILAVESSAATLIPPPIPLN